MILPGLLDVSGRSRRNAYRAMRELGQHRAEVDEAARAVEGARSARDLTPGGPDGLGTQPRGRRS